MQKTELTLGEIIVMNCGKYSYFIIPEEMKTYIKIFSIKIITTEDITISIREAFFSANVDPLVLKGKNILEYHQPIFINGQLLNIEVIPYEDFGTITCEIIWIPLDENTYQEDPLAVIDIRIERLGDDEDIELFNYFNDKSKKIIIYSLLTLNKENFEIIHELGNESTIYSLENNPFNFHFFFVSSTELFIKCDIETIEKDEYHYLNYNGENRNSIYHMGIYQ